MIKTHADTTGRLVAFTLLLLVSSTCNAQISWIDPQTSDDWVVEGRGWNEPGYGRLPAKAKSSVREPVWNLSQQSAGLRIRFWSNSPEIHLSYELANDLAMPHMPATGVSGFDLYRRMKEAGDSWVAAAKPNSRKATIKLAGGLDVDAQVPGFYTLYLPLYNRVTSLKIGVPETWTLEPAEPDSLKPIVVYGTSIAQGACASPRSLRDTACSIQPAGGYSNRSPLDAATDTCDLGLLGKVSPGAEVTGP